MHCTEALPKMADWIEIRDEGKLLYDPALFAEEADEILDGADAADVDAALSGLRFEAFRLRLKGIGVFGEGRNLRVLWAGVGANEELMRLQSKIVRAVELAGQPPEPRKFKPHITLARLLRKPPSMPTRTEALRGS